MEEKIKENYNENKYNLESSELPNISVIDKKIVGDMELEHKEIHIRGISLEDCYKYYLKIKEIS